MAAVLGILGAFIVAVISVAAHVSQATGKPEHAATYIDRFGAGTWANFTRDASGVVIGTGWAGAGAGGGDGVGAMDGGEWMVGGCEACGGAVRLVVSEL